MTLRETGEFGLIARIKEMFRSREIGDDCAVIPQSGASPACDTLITTDMLMEGTHFLAKDIPARDLGWKSAAVNFSDIAAMGGRAKGSFLALSLPRELPLEWVTEFMAGYKEMSDAAGAQLMGGDTTSSPEHICICVTALGECPHGAARLRSSALPGDLICVTGTLGDSAAGLRQILACMPREKRDPFLELRHYRPTPRLAEGLALAQHRGVHAMMDISDGIASDLPHILELSGVSAEVDAALLPLSEPLKKACAVHMWDPLALAAAGGEDYELLFTVTPDAERTLDIPHTIIGKIAENGPDCKLRWINAEGFEAFRHF